MQKTIILIGLAIVLVGVAYPALKKLPFGKLPGDIFFQSEHFSLSFPIVTCLVLSVLVTLLVNWLR